MRYSSALRAAALAAIAVFSYSGPAAGAEKYVVDRQHTSVAFSVKHMLITDVKGKFNDFEGTIMYDEEDVENTSVDGTIKVASIDTDNEKRDAHLASEDFFHAERHPEITFRSKKVLEREDGYVMIGDITMRGVTKEIEVRFEVVGKVVDPMGNVRIGLKARSVINRDDFGISWNRALETGGLVVGKDVQIDLDIQAIKSSE